jgi:dienelactone hydrolase
MRTMSRRSASLAGLGGLLGGRLAVRRAAAAEPRVLTGTIDGAEYRIEVPQSWNGTLLLFNHGAVRPGAPNPAVSARAGTQAWLLDQGYALAGSSLSRTGWAGAAEVAPHDNLALLDHFAAAVGRPRRTIAWGISLGGKHTALLAQQHPQRFDGALAICGVVEGDLACWNLRLDSAFVVKTLLPDAADLPIVHIPDPDAAVAQAGQLLARAQETPAGRARLALAAAVGDLPGWLDPASPPPAPDDYLAQAAAQVRLLTAWTLGANVALRWETEQWAGGNVSWNTGIDYGRQLERSTSRDEVDALYRLAGLDLGADLRALAAAPRVQADQPAATSLHAFAFDGRLGVPVLTLHTTGDGAVPVQSESAYASAVRAAGHAGLLRQAFVDRAGHLTFTPAELLSALRALVRRLDTGRWEGDDAATLNAEAVALGPELSVLAAGVPQPTPTPPNFIDFQPAPFLRPWDARCLSGVPVAPATGGLGPVCL